MELILSVSLEIKSISKNLVIELYLSIFSKKTFHIQISKKKIKKKLLIDNQQGKNTGIF